jgi:CrcB protein
MTRIGLIAIAGALGTLTRYGIAVWAGKTFGPGFPVGTLIVNVVGCFLIAAISYVALTTELVPPTVRLTLTTGFIGGMTTYSSFNLETTGLLQSRMWYVGLVNLGLTLFGCFCAGLLGVALARRWVGN